MRAWGRNGLAMLAGLLMASLTASACIAGVEAAAHAALPPDALFAAAARGLGAGALVGGAVASRVGRSPAPAWTLAGLLGALSLVNVLSFPHPVWFMPAAALTLLLGAWMAVRVAANAAPAV